MIDGILDLSEAKSSDLPEASLQMARLSLVDWLVCGRAGINEPVSLALREFAAIEAGRKTASVFGDGHFPARMAALVNGATSHSLDYDDTHFAHIGHLSVGIYPAALAAGEETDSSLVNVLAAFLTGAETAIRVGMTLGPAHYDRGFHQTATAGAFGATVAAGRLYGLPRSQMRHAIGLCATRASGLKSQFGTMGKPYNAGIAAANGIECAQLARLGLTSCDDGLLGSQAFIPTHSDSPRTLSEGDLHYRDRMLFDDIKYKFHACCHGTHAMIEALIQIRQESDITLDDVAKVRIATNPRWLSVCNIQSPRTGLETKFSYRWLAGMTLSGMETGDEKTYTDSFASDQVLKAFAERIEVEADDRLGEMQAAVELELKSGQKLTASHDLAAPLSLETLQAKLVRKSEVVLGDAARTVWDAVDAPDASARTIGKILRD